MLLFFTVFGFHVSPDAFGVPEFGVAVGEFYAACIEFPSFPGIPPEAPSVGMFNGFSVFRGQTGNGGRVVNERHRTIPGQCGFDRVDQ